MANSLSIYGLRALNVVWNSTVGTTPVSGRSNLLVPASAPEGVLLRKVAGIQEAISCGGLLLISTADASKWLFLCGDTLKAALTSGTVGKYATYGNPASPAKPFDLLTRPSWMGRYTYVNSSSGSPVRFVAGLQKEYFGGDLYRRLVLTDMFLATDTVAAYGLLTSATEGMGHGGVPGAPDVYSYMATQVPMNVPFSQFLTDIKSAQLASIPEKIRGYYDETFSEAVATFPRATKKPTVAITTIWHNGVEVAPVRWKPLKRTGAVGSGAFSIPGFVPTFQQVATGLRDPDSLQHPPDCVYRDVIPPVPTGFRDVNASPNAEQASQWNMAGSLRNMDRAGHSGSPLGEHKEYTLLGDNNVPRDVLRKQTGVISGLRAGLLRDGHLLKRSLIDELRYADDPPSHANLAELVIETLDDVTGVALGDRNSLTPEEFQSTEAEEHAEQITRVNDPKGRSIFQRGTLPQDLSAFSTRWDALAKAAAKR